MRLTLAARAFLIVVLMILPGCGSGGGGEPTTAAVATQSVVTLGTTVTQGSLASNQIKGIELYLALPAGVSVKTDSNGKTLSGVVAATGAATGASTAVLGNYPVTDPVSGNTNALKIVVANVDGFGTGNFVTVTCDRPSALFPNNSDFHINGFKAAQCEDVQTCGSLITGLECSASVTNN